MSAHLPRPYQVVPHPWYPLGLPSCVSLRIPGTEEASSLPNTHSMCAGRLPCLDLASAPSSILAWSSPKPTPAPCRLWPCRGAAFLAVDDRLGLALRLGSARLLGRSRDQGGRPPRAAPSRICSSPVSCIDLPRTASPAPLLAWRKTNTSAAKCMSPVQRTPCYS